MELKQQLIGQRDAIASQKGKVKNKRSDKYNQLCERCDELTRRISAI